MRTAADGIATTIAIETETGIETAIGIAIETEIATTTIATATIAPHISTNVF
jgi:hypothetical protein